MKIQPSKELDSIRNRLKDESDWIGDNIIKVLTDNGVIEPKEAYYGQTVGSCIALTPINPRTLLNHCLCISAYRKVNRKFLYEFESLVLIGDGDCPVCGGDLESVHTGSSKLVEPETRETPSVYEYERGDICLVCGNIFNLNYE